MSYCAIIASETITDTEGAMMTDEELHGLCQRVVLELMHKYGWHLIDEDDFVDIVVERANAVNAQTESGIQDIVKNVYSNTLHTACKGDEGSGLCDERNQAYEELGHYLYNIAHYSRPERPEDAKEATQKALVDIYQALRDDECRSPDAFLAFSIWRLRGALTHVARSKKVGGNEQFSWDQLLSGGRESDSSTEREPRLREEMLLASPEEKTEQNLLAEAIWDELKQKHKKHPRATHQLQAVFMKHALGYENQEIAEALGAPSTGAVSNLIFRGKEKLANNRRFQELFTLVFSR